MQTNSPTYWEIPPNWTVASIPIHKFHKITKLQKDIQTNKSQQQKQQLKHTNTSNEQKEEEKVWNTSLLNSLFSLDKKIIGLKEKYNSCGNHNQKENDKEVVIKRFWKGFVLEAVVRSLVREAAWSL